MKISILRHSVQILILVLFALGNAGILKILEGDLSSSLLFKSIGLSDPFAVLQLFLAGFSLASASIVGAFLVLLFYALIAPRAFCGWVCPINFLSDFATWVKAKFKLSHNLSNFSPNARYYLLVLVLVMSLCFHIAVFESFSQIGAFTRAVVFLNSSAFSIAIIILTLEIFVQKRLICSHLCPLGAFWAIVSRFSLIRIKHSVKNCTKCNACKAVCPEPRPLLLVGKNDGFVGFECISCARCVLACNDNALNFSILSIGEQK